jgi:hypothetical protein
MRAAFWHSISSGDCQKLSIPRRLAILLTEAPMMEARRGGRIDFFDSSGDSSPSALRELSAEPGREYSSIMEDRREVLDGRLRKAIVGEERKSEAAEVMQGR